MRQKIICRALFLVSHFIRLNLAHLRREIDFGKLEMNTQLLEGARWAIDESYSGQIINVYFAVDIQDIAKVEVDTMSIRIEFHVRERWQANDDLDWPPGLFNTTTDNNETSIRAPQKILDSIWSPDTFIPNARTTTIATFDDPKSVVNLFQNKTIVFKARMSTRLGCNFNIKWYPLDVQVCDLTFESYAWPDTFVRYQWETHMTPVTLSSFQLLQYELVLPLEWGNGTKTRFGRSEATPFVYLRFRFARKLGHQFIQVYFPTTLFVILSWFSFWIEPDEVATRVTLLITCMLTIVTTHASLKTSIPAVSYITMMDIWMVACITFVFAALGECTVVKYISWRKTQLEFAREQKEEYLKAYMKANGTHNKFANSKTSPRGDNLHSAFGRNMVRITVESKEDTNQRSSRPGLTDVNDKKDEQQTKYWKNRLNRQPSGFHQSVLCQHFCGTNSYTEESTKGVKQPVWLSIDKASRVVFGIAFGVFNVCYWPYLIIGSTKQ